jgi:hypothetical protein
MVNRHSHDKNFPRDLLRDFVICSILFAVPDISKFEHVTSTLTTEVRTFNHKKIHISFPVRYMFWFSEQPSSGS